MSYKVNFHTHSTASDGILTPTELVREAKNNGIEYLAITDHDTLKGQEEALKASREMGLNYQTGIELAAKEERYLHIVGLGVELGDNELTRLCKKLVESRDERNLRIVKYLNDKGIEITIEEVMKEAGREDNLGRPHFAKVMRDKNYVKNTDEAFQKYLATDEFQKIERFKPIAEDCFKAIHNAGGIAVMAHPWQIRYEDKKLYDFVGELKEQGLDGIEVYYPKHTKENIVWYNKIAKDYNLLVSAGTDYHGGGLHPESKLVPYELESIENLFKKGERYGI